MGKGSSHKNDLRSNNKKFVQPSEKSFTIETEGIEIQMKVGGLISKRKKNNNGF